MRRKGDRKNGEERKRREGRMGNVSGWRAEEDEGGRSETQRKEEMKVQKRKAETEEDSAVETCTSCL